MLNKNNERELAYVVHIDDIKPIDGADRVEQAIVGGWHIMVRKGQFQTGDGAIYFEIDSKVPETEPFAFLASKHYKVKTQKYFKGTVISQGLLMSAEDFGWKFLGADPLYGVCIRDTEGNDHYENDESRFLTKQLGVKYAVIEDNARKAGSVDKYKKMAQRNGKLFSHQPFCWLMQRNWGKKLLFVFFGRKKDKKDGWPAWVNKTDEERVENMLWVLDNKEPLVATEKIDGTSTTFTMKRSKRNKYNFYVCSRNVVFDEPDKQCFYPSNVYIEMAEKYNIESHLKDMLKNHREWDWVTIQGETYGIGIQKNDYDLKDHRFAAFNLVTSDRGRWGTEDMIKFLTSEYNIPCVPLIDNRFILPNSIEELREIVHSKKSAINNKMKEGIVFRKSDGTLSFKCVDPEYLMKY